MSIPFRELILTFNLVLTPQNQLVIPLFVGQCGLQHVPSNVKVYYRRRLYLAHFPILFIPSFLLDILLVIFIGITFVNIYLWCRLIQWLLILLHLLWLYIEQLLLLIPLVELNASWRYEGSNGSTRSGLLWKGTSTLELTPEFKLLVLGLVI